MEEEEKEEEEESCKIGCYVHVKYFGQLTT